MAERKCLMTFYPTDCKDNCFNCKCGGAEATKDMYVSIHDVQRVCAITGGAADTDVGEHIAEVIRNNLENMVMPAADVQPVKRGRWSECYTDSHHYSGICTVCGKASIRSIKENPLEYCPKCGARMDGGNEDENSI